jgi:hypothetical protein
MKLHRSQKRKILEKKRRIISLFIIYTLFAITTVIYLFICVLHIHAVDSISIVFQRVAHYLLCYCSIALYNPLMHLDILGNHYEVHGYRYDTVENTVKHNFALVDF